MKVISFWCWGQVLILYSTSFSDCFIFKYIHCILNILFARIRCHWRTQTDILAKCVSVAKYLANTLWIPTLHRWCVESLQSLISVSLVFKMAQFTSDITKGPELLTAAEERLIRCGLLLLLYFFFVEFLQHRTKILLLYYQHRCIFMANINISPIIVGSFFLCVTIHHSIYVLQIISILKPKFSLYVVLILKA